jgi:porin
MDLRNTAYALLLLAPIGAAEPVDFSAEYTGDILAVVSGGLSTGTSYLDNLDLELEVDLAEAWDGGAGKLRVHGLYNNATTFSEIRVGDLQVVSNIDTSGGWRLFEFWYEFGDSNWSVRTGLYDLNSEFDVNETGGLFLNSSHGIGGEFGMSGRNGPGIFPVSAFSLRTAMKLGPVTARVVVMDGVPGDPDKSSSNRIDLSGEDGALTVYEVDAPYAESARLWLGYWRYSAEFEQVDGAGFGRGNDGWYVGSESALRLGSREASWFIRFGQADERFNLVSGYVGLGAVVAGAIKGRPADRLGIAVASARAGDPYRESIAARGERASRHETTWELTYEIRLNERVLIQPDIQYVRNPSLSPDLDDAWIVGCRFQLTY